MGEVDVDVGRFEFGFYIVGVDWRIRLTEIRVTKQEQLRGGAKARCLSRP
jgi:hypothetical protein